MTDDLRFIMDHANGVFELRAGAIMVRRTPTPRLLMVTSESLAFTYSVGGAVSFGETTREALAREIREETGVDLPIGELAAIEQAVYHDDDDGRDWHIVALHYWVEVPPDFNPVSTSVTLSGKPERLCWIGADEIAAGLTYYPIFYKDALEGEWSGVRHIIDRPAPSQPDVTQPPRPL